MSPPTDVAAALANPGVYPHHPDAVEVVQTHISWVFLAGPEVFKVKKPVCFGFLDFRSLEDRRHFCEEEVRLNRRLAPEVYLGVVPITRGPEGWRVDGTGAPVEWAVRMRRLPADRSLHAVVDRGEADDALMRRIAEKVARFHAAVPPVNAGEPGGAPEELAAILAQNFATLATATPGAGAELPRLVARALARATGRLRARRRAGRVREGHGDLRADHVYCTETLPIIDCVEFAPHLRRCDVAAEVAFLAMELEALDAPALGRTFLDAYVAASGDADLPAVIPLFRAYRAQVRAMVAALTAAEPEVPAAERATAADAVARYLAIAERAAWEGNGPVVLAIGGTSGTGKSTVARALVERTGFAWLRSDVVRKATAGLVPEARATGAAARRLYDPARTAEVYATLGREAAAHARRGASVVVDATFHRRAERHRFAAALAAERIAPWWVECRVAPEVARARLAARARAGDDPSDADWSVAETQRREGERFDELAADRRFVLDTGDTTPAALAGRVATWIVDGLTS